MRKPCGSYWFQGRTMLALIHEIFSDLNVSKCEGSHMRRGHSFMWWLQMASGGQSLIYRWLCPERVSVGITHLSGALLGHSGSSGMSISGNQEGGGMLCALLAAPYTWFTLAKSFQKESWARSGLLVTLGPFFCSRLERVQGTGVHFPQDLDMS